MKLITEARHSFCSEIANSKGIMISPKKISYQAASNVVWTYLRHHLSDLDTTHAPFVLVHKGCIFKRYYYSVGDVVVVDNDDVMGTPYKAKIREIYSHDHNMYIETYFSADYYQHQPFYENGRQSDMLDSTTHMHLLKRSTFVPFDDTCIRPIRCIKHKFMRMENPRQGNNKYLAYETEDNKMRNELALD
jgi:signal peptidase I